MTHPDGDTLGLSVVIVSWNVRSLLHDCLDSVSAACLHCALRAEVIVVDNASSDGTVDMVNAHHPAVKLLANPVNLGFTKANNQALRLARGRYVLLLNPDTRADAASFGQMVDYLDNHPRVGAVGPRLIFPDGSVQPSRRRFPTLATAFLESTPLQRLSPDHPALRAYYIFDRQDGEEQAVDWLVGACLMVRAAALEKVGLLDEGFFMYSEELDLCRRLKAAGFSISYLPEASVVHHEAKSSDQNVLARHQHFHDSKVRYFRKYHGALPAFALRLFIVFSFAFMLVEEALKYLLVPGKRSWRKPRLPVLAAALRYHCCRIGAR